MSYADEIKGLTGDPGARRLGELVDLLTDRLDHCCPRELDVVRTASQHAAKSSDTNSPTSR